jgi:diaminopimelate decarboxylase
MHFFDYLDDRLQCEDVSVERICGDIGTPVFIYSRATMERHLKIFQESFSTVEHLVCFSVKACSNIAVLKVLSNLGAGADIVSGGELFRALMAGVDPSRIVYSGVGKKSTEMDEALKTGILMFNVESEEELTLLSARAQEIGVHARVALRVNPDVDPKTHAYISTGLRENKFGIEIDKAFELYKQARDMKGIVPIGVDCHIGSQLTQLSPVLDAIKRLLDLVNKLRNEGVNIKYFDVGGGLGIPYSDELPPLPSDYGSAIVDLVKDMDLKLILEPGRVLVGNAGILCTRVLYQKKGSEKNFVVVDAAMNDLIRPSLYKAHHAVRKVSRRTGGAGDNDTVIADLVGPICESGDFLARSREMQTVTSGDLLALMSAGAYGFSMSSNYNSRPRAAEVLVDGSDYYVIRERENYEDLVRGECIPLHVIQT